MSQFLAVLGVKGLGAGVIDLHWGFPNIGAPLRDPKIL